MNEQHFLNLLNNVAEEMKVRVDIPISIVEDNDLLGVLSCNIDDDLNVKLIELKFNRDILKCDIKFIEKVIKHELIHYKILIKNKSQIYNLLNMLFPHGLGFIFYAIKYKTWWIKYVITLGLTQNQLKLLKNIRIVLK